MTFEDVYWKYRPALMRMLHRLCEQYCPLVEAEDMFQEAMIRAWREWPTLQMESMWYWLKTICRRVVFEARRSQHAVRRGRAITFVPYNPETDTRAEPRCAELSLYVKQLQEKFHCLHPVERSTLEAVCNGHTVADISEARGVGFTAVHNSLVRSRKHLIEILGGNEHE